MTDPAEKNILVVDDEEDVRDFLKLALTEAGFTVRTASDGIEALACYLAYDSGSEGRAGEWDTVGDFVRQIQSHGYFTDTIFSQGL